MPGQVLEVIRLGGVDIALTICEDIWQAGGPFAAARQAGVALVVNINGSPYELAKDDIRLPWCSRRAAEAGAVVAYLNMTGGQDELVFDGDSMVVAPDGTLLARAAQFAEAVAHPRPRPARCRHAGAADCRAWPTRWSCPHRHHRRTGRARCRPADRHRGPTGDRRGRGVAGAGAGPARLRPQEWLPVGHHRGSPAASTPPWWPRSPSTRWGPTRCTACPCQQLLLRALPGRRRRAGPADRPALPGATHPADGGQRSLAQLELSGIAMENLQARVRGVILMGLSNQDNHLVLTTGNKSELAVGYSTLYGDSVGGFNPLKDVPKTMVWRLAAWRNAEAARRGETPPIPENSISKPPSAELRPGQLDTDSLPDYDVAGPDPARTTSTATWAGTASSAAGHDQAIVDRVLRMVDPAEYKRRQSAPGPKISIKAFGRDRRLPITNRLRETADRPRAGRVTFPPRSCAAGRRGATIATEPGDREGAASRKETDMVESTPNEVTALYGGAGHPAGPHPRPDRRQGARRTVGRCSPVRPVHRRDLRPGRRPGAAGRRLGREQRVRLRDHPAGDRRGAAAAGAGRGRATQHALVVGDLPFGSYEEGPTQALRTAVRFMKEGGCHAVKLEGGRRCAAADRGYRRCRHSGDGAHRVHPAERAHPRRLPGAGPGRHGRRGARRRAGGGRGGRVRGGAGDGARRGGQADHRTSCAIPTVGIGAGPDTDAQVLVWQDMAGLRTGKAPRFVKRYADLAGVLTDATRPFRRRGARRRRFPGRRPHFLARQRADD